MVALTRLLAVLVRALTRTRRRRVASIAIPALVLVAVIAPRAAGRDAAAPRGVLADAPAATTAGAPTGAVPTTPQVTGLPGTTGPAPGPTPRSRPAPVLDGKPAAAARDYVTTTNSHDARPGQDRDFLDAYVRARPYVTPQLYAQISAPSRRGDYLWTQWVAQQATVTVEVLRVAVPDGAPVPTATTAYVRVQFRQVVTPHVAGARPASTDGAMSLVVSKNRDGDWLVSRLLADI
jgi:hypothetical protein